MPHRLRAARSMFPVSFGIAMVMFSTKAQMILNMMFVLPVRLRPLSSDSEHADDDGEDRHHRQKGPEFSIDPVERHHAEDGPERPPRRARRREEIDRRGYDGGDNRFV